MLDAEEMQDERYREIESKNQSEMTQRGAVVNKLNIKNILELTQ